LEETWVGLIKEEAHTHTIEAFRTVPLDLAERLAMSIKDPVLMNSITKKRRRYEVMKKALLVGFAVFISMAFVTVVFAQTSETKETTTTTTNTPEKKETTTTTTTMKHKRMMFKGEVTNVDMAAKMMTVKGKKGDMDFDISSAKIKRQPMAGDKVSVKYMEKDGKMMASSVHMRKMKKTKTTTTTTTTTDTKEEPTK
jgi:hypothetical protein